MMVCKADASSGSISYAQAVREAIRVGGCNASRATAIGACYGAMFGAVAPSAESGHGVPAPWVGLLGDGGELLHLARQLVDLRKDAASKL